MQIVVVDLIESLERYYAPFRLLQVLSTVLVLRSFSLFLTFYLISIVSITFCSLPLSSLFSFGTPLGPNNKALTARLIVCAKQRRRRSSASNPSLPSSCIRKLNDSIAVSLLSASSI